MGKARIMAAILATSPQKNRILAALPQADFDRFFSGLEPVSLAQRQVLFGVSVATIYGLLFVTHVVFGLFIALALTSAARGLGLYAYALWQGNLVRQPQERYEVPKAIGLAS